MTRATVAGFWAVLASAWILVCTGAYCRAAEPEVRAALVMPQQFSPANEGLKFAFQAGGLGPLCATQGAGYFVARVDVPNGARITALEAVFDGITNEAFGVVTLFRYGEKSRDFLVMTPMSLPRAVREATGAALREPEIVREGFQYWLHLTLTGPGVCLRRARVFFQPEGGNSRGTR